MLKCEEFDRYLAGKMRKKEKKSICRHLLKCRVCSERIRNHDRKTFLVNGHITEAERDRFLRGEMDTHDTNIFLKHFDECVPCNEMVSLKWDRTR